MTKKDFLRENIQIIVEMRGNASITKIAEAMTKLPNNTFGKIVNYDVDMAIRYAKDNGLLPDRHHTSVTTKLHFLRNNLTEIISLSQTRNNVEIAEALNKEHGQSYVINADDIFTVLSENKKAIEEHKIAKIKPWNFPMLKSA